MEECKRCLKQSIDGESTAVSMYSDFASKADEENLPKIANLFRSLAKAERVHIKNHKSALKQPDYEAVLDDYSVGSTIDNLKAAIEGETYEFKKMYPRFFKDIKKEQHTEYGKVAMLSMQWSSSVEANHAKLLKLALKLLQNGEDFDTSNIYVCKVCGNVEIDKPTKACSVCGHDVTFFELIQHGA